MITFNQAISERDYKKAIAIHYFAYKYTYISPVLGLLVILSFLLLIAVLPNDVVPETPYFLLLFGLFMVLRPVFYIYNILKSVKSSKLLLAESTIEITPDDTIITSINGSESSINLKDLYAFLDSRSFIFLYVARNHYTILDKRRISTVDTNILLEKLRQLQIKER